jgi:hypothetical protein
MALDIRLDFISNIAQEQIDGMKVVRKKFIEIDSMLSLLADDAQERKIPSAARTVALARTANEAACQSAIKSLCILGEVKE